VAELDLNFADEINDGAIILHDGGCRSPKLAEAHGFQLPASE
jgi:hypothetical protein